MLQTVALVVLAAILGYVVATLAKRRLRIIKDYKDNQVNETMPVKKNHGYHNTKKRKKRKK